MSNPFLNTTQVNAIIRIRRGPDVDRFQFVYDDGELIYSTDKKRLFIVDGSPFADEEDEVLVLMEEL